MPDIVTTDVLRDQLNALGYDDSLIERRWSPVELATGEPALLTPILTAFWDAPHDQFRSAIAVAFDGLPGDVAAAANCHVLMCRGDQAELWLLRPSGLRCADKVMLSGSAIADMLRDHGKELKRERVAADKIETRLQPCALRDGNCDRRAGVAAMQSVVADVEREWADKTDEWARWLLCVLMLRIGGDREWWPQRHAEQLTPAGVVFTGIGALGADVVTGRVGIKAAEGMAKTAWEALEPLCFRTTDVLLAVRPAIDDLLVKALPAAERAASPSFAWDVACSLPLSERTRVFDPCVGTGDFLLAAGHAAWHSHMRERRRTDFKPFETIAGADASPLAVDAARLLMLSAFDTPGATATGAWRIDVAAPSHALDGLAPDDTHYALYAPRYSVLDECLAKAATMRSVAVAGVLPKDTLSSQAFRERVGADFQLETAWHLARPTIDRNAAVMLWRPRTKSVGIWKQADIDGRVATVGYTRVVDAKDPTLPEHPFVEFMKRVLQGPTSFAEAEAAGLVRAAVLCSDSVLKSLYREFCDRDFKNPPLPAMAALETLEKNAGQNTAWDDQKLVCDAYGLTLPETTAALAMAHLLGWQPPNGASRIEQLMASIVVDEAKVKSLREQYKAAGNDIERERLYMETLRESQRADHIAFENERGSVSITKRHVLA